MVIVLVAATGFVAADLTWKLLGEEEAAVSAAYVRSPNTKSKESSVPDYSGLSSLHLFGESRAPVEPQETSFEEAPKTNLQLYLRGVFLAEGSGRSIAIIADHSGQERAYRVGDELTGDATIKQIQPYRVLLERNGRIEALEFPKQELAQRGTVEPAPRGGGTAEYGRVPRVVVTNATEIAKHLTLTPVSVNGKLKGYRVAPRGDSKIFRDAGLSEGDLVTRVDGFLVTDPSLLGSLMQKLSTAEQVALDLQNGNQRRKLTIRLE